MYKAGEFVNYGAHGICQIVDICSKDFKTGSGEQNYYILQPISQGSTTFYLPATESAAQARLRPVLTVEQIDQIIASVKDAQMPWITDRKLRLAKFQQIVSHRDTAQLLLLASSLHQQQLEKGLSTGDRETLHKIEGIIEQEFSFALGLGAKEIGSYIQNRLSITTQEE